MQNNRAVVVLSFTQRISLPTGIVVATLLAFLVFQGFSREFETQTADARGAEDLTHTEVTGQVWIPVKSA
jgi:hypothetical protein